MSDFFTPGWISDWLPAVLGLLIVGLNVVLSKLRAHEGPAWGIRSIQATLALLLALMIYSVYLQMTG